MMRSIIRNILREMASTNLKTALIAMGPKKANESLKISLEDYVTMAYDNDIIDYVSDHIPELTDLTRYNTPSYYYNGEGPFSGLVFQYVKKGKTRKGDIVLPLAIVPQFKLNYLKRTKLLTEEMFIEFINEFYDLNVTKIVPVRETNYG